MSSGLPTSSWLVLAIVSWLKAEELVEAVEDGANRIEGAVPETLGLVDRVGPALNSEPYSCELQSILLCTSQQETDALTVAPHSRTTSTDWLLQPDSEDLVC